MGGCGRGRYGDNYLFDLDEYQYHVNQTGDAFPNDSTQWNDTDGDGYGDNYENASWNRTAPPHGPASCFQQPTCPMLSHLTERNTLTATETGWVIIQTATDPMLVPTSGEIRSTTVWAAQTVRDGYFQSSANWPST